MTEIWRGRTVAVLAVGLALLLVVGAVGPATGQQDDASGIDCDEDAKTLHATLAGKDASSVRQWVETQALKTKQLSRLPVVESGNTSLIRNWFLNERSQNAEWGGNSAKVHYVDLDEETILASSDPINYEGQDFGAFNESVAAVLSSVALGGGVERTMAYVGKDGHVRIAFVAAIDDDRDTTRAIVYTVRPNSFGVAGIGETDRSGVTMVVDSQNRIIMEEYGTEEVLLRNYTQSAWKQPLTEARALEGGAKTAMVYPEPASGVLSGSFGDKKINYQLEGNEYVVGASPVTDIRTYAVRQSIPWVVLSHQACSDNRIVSGGGNDDSNVANGLDGGDADNPDGGGDSDSSGGIGPGFGPVVALLAVALVGVGAIRRD